MSNDLTRLARAAEWYAEKKGWQVFPLHTITADGCSCRNKECDRQGKHPRTEHGLHDASTDIGDIARWWRTWPDANIGIRTGSASGLVVLDVDVKECFYPLQLGSIKPGLIFGQHRNFQNLNLPNPNGIILMGTGVLNKLISLCRFGTLYLLSFFMIQDMIFL